MTDPAAIPQNLDKDLWSKALDELTRMGVTRDTFNSLLEGTTGRQQNGRLTVCVKSAYTLDLLENRLRSKIEQAVRRAGDGGEVVVEFEVAGSEVTAYQADLFYQGSYRDAYNEIVKPDSLLCTTRYFHDQWRPLLGNDLWLLIWEMRRRCFWNKANPDKSRDTFEATYGELAVAVGVSVPTVRRLLYPEDPDKQKLLARFVTRIGIKRGYSKKIGKVVNEKTSWRVRLDDPLTPDDEKHLEEKMTKSSKSHFDT